MTRRLFLLSGLAILAVVCNHAASYGITDMFVDANHYRPVAVPNFDQYGSFTYYILRIIEALTVFSVPAFLFVSGFFMAYVARGNQRMPVWKTVRIRIFYLLVPYLVWCIVFFIFDAAHGVLYKPLEYFSLLLTGAATPPFWFVPVICQLYLLAPFVLPLAKTRWKQLLLVSGLLQLFVITTAYFRLFGLINIAVPSWFFAYWGFYFSLGLVSGFRVEGFKQWLSRVKSWLLVLLILFAVLAITEPEIIYRYSGTDLMKIFWGLSKDLYAITFLLCFIAFSYIPLPLSKALTQLSNKTYGIYLISPIVMAITYKIILHAAPRILAYQLLTVLILILLSLGIPYLMMIIFAHTPARKYYAYFFG